MNTDRPAYWCSGRPKHRDELAIANEPLLVEKEHSGCGDALRYQLPNFIARPTRSAKQHHPLHDRK